MLFNNAFALPVVEREFRRNFIGDARLLQDQARMIQPSGPFGGSPGPPAYEGSRHAVFPGLPDPYASIPPWPDELPHPMEAPPEPELEGAPTPIDPRQVLTPEGRAEIDAGIRESNTRLEDLLQEAELAESLL